MKRFLLAIALALALVAPATAYPISQNHTYVDGETLTQSILNPNFQTIYAWANGGVDNTNIGSAGIFASQILAGSVAQGTFGGTFGYTFLTPAANVVPLTIDGVTSQSADILDIMLTSGGTKAWWTSNLGYIEFGKLGGKGSITANASMMGDAAGGLLFGAETGQEFQWTSGATLIAVLSQVGNFSAIGNVSSAGGYVSTLAAGGTQISFPNSVNNTGFSTGAAVAGISGTLLNILDTGTINAVAISRTGSVGIAGQMAAQSNGSTPGFVPPMYTAAGSALATTTHGVYGTGTTAASGTGAVTITLSGAAAFTSATSYACGAVTNTSQTPIMSYPAVGTISGTAFSVAFATSTSSAFTGAFLATNFNWFCFGS